MRGWLRFSQYDSPRLRFGSTGGSSAQPGFGWSDPVSFSPQLVSEPQERKEKNNMLVWYRFGHSSRQIMVLRPQRYNLWRVKFIFKFLFHFVSSCWWNIHKMKIKKSKRQWYTEKWSGLLPTLLKFWPIFLKDVQKTFQKRYVDGVIVIKKCY